MSEIGKITRIGKHLDAILVGMKAKTDIYEIQNIESGFVIGTIEWRGRGYWFFTNGEIQLEAGCCEELAKFLRNLKAKTGKKS